MLERLQTVSTVIYMYIDFVIKAFHQIQFSFFLQIMVYQCLCGLATAWILTGYRMCSAYKVQHKLI